MDSRYVSFFQKRKWLGNTARVLSLKGFITNLVILYAILIGDIHTWMNNLLFIHFDITSFLLTNPYIISLQVAYFTYAAIDNVLGMIKGCIRPIAGFAIEKMFFFIKGVFISARK